MARKRRRATPTRQAPTSSRHRHTQDAAEDKQSEGGGGSAGGWSHPQVLAAIVAAVATVIGAALSAGLLWGDDDEGQEPAGSEQAGPVATLRNYSYLPDPPRIRFNFEGEYAGLDEDDAVLVLASIGGEERTAAAPFGAFTASPPAELLPNGTWRLEWLMEEQPASGAKFSPIVYEDAGVTSVGILPSDEREEIESLGPFAPGVVGQSDAVVYAPPPPAFGPPLREESTLRDLFPSAP